MTKLDKATVIAALRPEDVAQYFAIPGQWRGRWMRSSRCAYTDHGSDAFGLSRQGFWHCHSCDKGGDLLALIAFGEKLDLKADFGKVLEIAAKIAGIDPDPFEALGKPAPKERPPLPPMMPLAERIALAKRRAAWVWERLGTPGQASRMTELYLKDRGLDLAAVRLNEDIRETPLRCTLEQISKSVDLKSLAYLFAAPAVAVAVRGLDGSMTDIRVRRMEPREGQPKIVGMLGGVTDAPADNGRVRQLVGCYGQPHNAGAHDLVVVVEGLMDYLTALVVWPNAMVLGAVNAGQLGLVVGHVARQMAETSKDSRLIIVEQADPPRMLKDGTMRIGAADASVNEDPNAATKVAVRILGPKRVGWLMCSSIGHLSMDGGPAKTLTRDPRIASDTKDLNDLIRNGVDAKSLVVWWTEIGQAA